MNCDELDKVIKQQLPFMRQGLRQGLDISPSKCVSQLREYKQHSVKTSYTLHTFVDNMVIKKKTEYFHSISPKNMKVKNSKLNLPSIWHLSHLGHKKYLLANLQTWIHTILEEENHFLDTQSTQKVLTLSSHTSCKKD